MGTLFGRVDIHLPQVILAVIFRREVFLSNPRLILSGQPIFITARLAQSVEHETLNLRVVGSSPTLGASFVLLHPMTVYYCHNNCVSSGYTGAVA